MSLELLDIGSKPCRILVSKVGGEPLDVAELLIQFTTKNRNPDNGGLITTTATLELMANPLEPWVESLDPLRNPLRWSKGNKVEVWVEDAGTFQRHPRGSLLILKNPTRPSPSNPVLMLELGCELSYKAGLEPEVEEEITTPSAGSTLLAKILNKAGLPLAGLPSGPTYPSFKISGGLVDLAGELAIAHGSYLWINGAGSLQSTYMNFDPVAPDLLIEEGEEEISLEPMPPGEIPSDRLTVSGNSPEKPAGGSGSGSGGEDEPKDPEPEISVIYSTPNALFGSGGNITIVAEVKRIEYQNFYSRQPKIRQLSRRPAGAVMSEARPKDRSFVSFIDTSESFFEDGDRGYLVEKRQTTEEPKGVSQPDRYPGNGTTAIAKISQVFYTYEDEATKALESRDREQYGRVHPEDAEEEEPTSGTATDASGSRALQLVLSSISRQSWRQIDDQRWRTETSTINCGPGGGTSSGFGVSGSGNTQPPAPEFWQGIPTTTEEISSSATIKNGNNAAGEHQIRMKDGVLVEQYQADRIANILVRFQQGANAGITLEGELSGFWLAAWRPFKTIQITQYFINQAGEMEAEVGRYMAISDAFSITPDGASFAVDCILIGTIRRYTPESGEPVEWIEPPFSTQWKVEAMVEPFGSVQWLPYALQDSGEAVVGIIEPFAQTDAGERLRAWVEIAADLSGDNPNLDWIVVDSAGEVVTHEGRVVSSRGNFADLLVDSAGEVVTHEGRVVSRSNAAYWVSIAVDSNGRIVTHNGAVVRV